jgi:hypothetical protein
MADDEAYWFPAKRIGWGWGLPHRWQGWAVLAAYLAVVLVLVRFFPPETQPMAFGFGVAFATAVLILVCLLKGEPPRWHGPLL